MIPAGDQTTRDATDYNEVMTIIGFGRVHWWLLLTCGLLLMEVLAETMGMAIISPASKCDFDADVRERAYLNSAAFVGIICSSLVWGYFCDLRGRHKMLLLSVGIANCCSIISTFMPTFIPFLLMRFLTGIFAAGPSFIALTYISEFCTHRHRQLVLNYMFMFNGFAMLYCPGLAGPILDFDWELPLVGSFKYYSWHLLAQLYILPGVLGFLLLIKLPESPKFLLSVGREEAAFDVLDWLCRINTGRPLHDFEVYRIKGVIFRSGLASSHSLGPQMWFDVRPLFRQPYVQRFILSCVIMFGLFMNANGLGIWFTDIRNRNDIFDDMGHEIIRTRTICKLVEKNLTESNIEISINTFVCSGTFLSFGDSIKLGVAIILLYQSLGLLLLVFPRKLIFILPLILAGACGISLTWIENPELVLLMFILLLALPAAVTNLLGGTIVEFVPTYLRGKAVSLCMMFGRIGVIFGSTCVGHFLDDYCVITFNSFAVVLLVCGTLGYWLPL